MSSSHKEWRANLRAALKKRNLQIKEAARLVDRNPEWLSRVLNNKYNPSLDHILLLCERADIPIGELFGSEEEFPHVAQALRAISERFSDA